MLLEKIAKLNLIPVIVAVMVLSVSGLHALVDLLSQPKHPLLAQLRLLLPLTEEVAVEEEVAQSIVAAVAAAEASAMGTFPLSIIACFIHIILMINKCSMFLPCIQGRLQLVQRCLLRPLRYF